MTRSYCGRSINVFDSKRLLMCDNYWGCWVYNLVVNTSSVCTPLIIIDKTLIFRKNYFVSRRSCLADQSAWFNKWLPKKKLIEFNWTRLLSLLTTHRCTHLYGFALNSLGKSLRVVKNSRVSFPRWGEATSVVTHTDKRKRKRIQLAESPNFNRRRKVQRVSLLRSFSFCIGY